MQRRRIFEANVNSDGKRPDGVEVSYAFDVLQSKFLVALQVVYPDRVSGRVWKGISANLH
jgi:hypothetical protein